MSKVMLITGASRGIGRFLAEHYLAGDYTVCGCSRSSSDLSHPSYQHVELDVGDEAGVRRMVADAVRNHGGIDVLINNAGVASMNHAFLTPTSTLEKVFRVNVFGAFSFCREAGKVMQKRGGGRIVNFSTVAVPLNLEGEAAYAASKAAVETLTKVLAREFGPFGITCNALGPCPIRTDLIKNVPQTKLDALIRRQALQAFAEPEDVANATDFFLAKESGMVTGQVLYLGGVG